MNLKPLKYLLFFLSPVLFTGCSVWGNFTTYFNLYYNTSNTFDEAEELIKSQQRDLFSAEPLVVPGSASPLLVKVVEKSTSILQFHAESSFVDEALMMLGKSFYYQRNYLKALRKFSELIATQPESEFILEARLWIAKTQMMLKNYDEAIPLLESVRVEAVEEGEEDFVKDAFVEEVVYKIQIKQYEEAIKLCTEFLQVSDDDEINADVAYELGKLYETTGNHEEAVIAFRRVYDYSPSYDLDYKANIELGRALRESGKTEEALDQFIEMKSEDKYSDFYDEVDLERGITLNMLDRPEEAIEVLIDVDTAYATSLNSGIARLKIGEIYENKILNYDSATSYYKKAALSQAPPEYVVLSAAKNKLFTKYNTLASTMRSNEKQLEYVTNPDSFTKDSLEYAQKMEELKAEEDVSFLFVVPEDLDTSKTKLDSLVMLKTLDSLGILKKFDSVYVKTELDSLEMTGILDSIKFADNERKLNEQRQQQRQQQQLEKGGGDTGGGETIPGGTDTSAASKLVPPVKTGLSADSLKKLLAANKFDLGNLFFTELNVRDSAYFYYKDVIENYPGSRYEGQTIYALGSYFQAEGDSVKADSLFNVVYDNYKTENVVNAAATQLKKPLINLKYDPAEELYVNAEKVMINEDFDSSVVSYYSIFEQFPESPLAPKALYAGGWILENELKLNDSAAVFYDSIVVNYPMSEYTSLVLPKLNVYKQEQEKIKRAIEDSLALIQQQQQEQDTSGQIISRDLLPSDTTKVFDQIDKSMDKTNVPDDTLRIDQEELNEYGNPEYFQNPDQPVDSLNLLQQTMTDTLQGQGRRGVDSTFSPPIDSLIPGNPDGR